MPGSTEQISLYIIAILLLKKAQLALILDPFRNHCDIEGMRQLNHRSHQAGIVAIRDDTMDKLPVNLQ